MITKETTNKVADMVRALLAERYQDEFVFDPIIVESKFDHDDEEYLNINIVFDGDQDRLDIDWIIGLVGRMRPALLELGVTGVPGKSFIEKSEWEETFASRYRES